MTGAIRISMDEQFPPLRDERLLEFEGRLGRPLPADYRSFLRATNGGRPRQRSFRYADEAGPYTDSVVHFFLGLHEGEHERLDFTQFNLRDRVPSAFLPIAGDPFGNYVCIGTHGVWLGKIYFWDHEQADERHPDAMKCMHRIADSFNEFLAALRETE